MIKMIVSDMDGTLLNSKKQLPNDFAEVYEQITKAGIQFVVASGRQYYTLIDEFAHLDHNIAFVAENGGYIGWNEQTKVMQPLLMTEIKPLILAAREAGSNIVLCGKEAAYVENTSSDAFKAELAKYYAKHQLVDDLLRVDDHLLKIAINDFSNIETQVYPLLKARFGHLFQISTSSPIWLDVMPNGINKGRALQFLQQELGISANETMAFGDYLNDYEMLQVAGHSYAMANAHPDIKEVARFSTLSNDESGVLHAIRKSLAQLTN
ncbi:HAD family hydrolase [Carboxylicivirga sediminis]|uniref:HAD family hydrolase n=1 Tax=Carboxylicivirga sediminis TaxID=2006564 RepID=A0A941F1U5_9BACT|nr:HAD family hydrolase [Carboxylicivirga sediminis]MBR8535181.1 HAD family hydrolase [Carboxylicivirga sediminis]